MVFIDWMLGHALYAGLIATLVLCGLGLPIPEEVTFLAAGYAGAKHDANIIALCACGLIGIMLGDSIPYFVGKHYGMSFLSHAWITKLVKPRHVEATQVFFAKRGSKAILIARFLAGLRMPTFFMAGAMGVPFLTFFFWDLLGALVSCPVSIWVAYTFGESVAEKFVRQTHVFVFGAIGLCIVIVLYKWWRYRCKRVMVSVPAGDVSHAHPATPVESVASSPAKEGTQDSPLSTLITNPIQAPKSR